MLADPVVRRFTNAEYMELFSSGVLGEDAHVELHDGLVVEVMTPDPPHSRAVRQLMQHLGQRLDLLLVQDAFDGGEGYMPEPDLALARMPSVEEGHPDAALLAVEVVHKNRAEAVRKVPVYGAAGVPIYWIVDLPRQHVRVLTDPRPDGYATERILSGDDLLDPQVEGIAPFAVREVLA